MFCKASHDQWCFKPFIMWCIHTKYGKKSDQKQVVCIFTYVLFYFIKTRRCIYKTKISIYIIDICENMCYLPVYLSHGLLAR